MPGDNTFMNTFQSCGFWETFRIIFDNLQECMLSKILMNSFLTDKDHSDFKEKEILTSAILGLRKNTNP